MSNEHQTALDQINDEIAAAEQAKKDAAKEVRALKKARVTLMEEALGVNE